jgi:PKD repeat protein
MKTLIASLVGTFAIFTGQAAAQTPVEVIVYDACYPYYWGAEVWEWAMTCDSYLVTSDGKGAVVGNGAAPAISHDGGRVAFAGDDEPGIFVVNLSDWSRAKVSEFGEAPAWSPDGSKLAFAAGALFIMSADGSSVTQLTNNYAGQPAWSPDGLRIAFDCHDGGGYVDICSINIDGTGFMQLTSDPAWDSGAAYSPDGLTVAFATTRFGGGSRIAVMNPDGTQVRQVGASIAAVRPAWSPDGTRIAFGISYSPEGYACNADGSICWGSLEQTEVWTMRADGSEEQAILWGSNPAWGLAGRPVASFISHPCNGLTCSFDGSGSFGGNGTRSYSWDFGDGATGFGPATTHSYGAPGTYTVTLTAEDGAGVTGTQRQSVIVIDAGNLPPTAAYSYACTATRQCTFDGSGSSDADGPIVTYSWSFGDGGTASGETSPLVTHTYGASGAFAVTLTVTDDAGATGTQQQVVNIVNVPPAASFTPACIALTCTFDGSGSSDVDGTIASHVWNFGDGTSGSGATVSHTYAGGGSYAVTLTVTDNGAATSSQTQTVTVVLPEMHVGDLDGVTASMQNSWTATVTVTIHDRSHGAVSNATVIGSWNDGSAGSCTTNASGQCVVSRSGILKKTHIASFSITSVARALFVYAPAANHDTDGDSNGVTMSVSRP